MQTIELEGEQLVIREARAADLSLIFPTWMESARELRNTRRGVFDSFYPSIVRGLLETEPVFVATRNDTIHGWACGRSPNLLHFAYVPFKLRGKGLGRKLISTALDGYPKLVWVTASPLSIPRHPRYVFNPFVLRSS